MAAKLKVWIHERETITSEVQSFGPDSGELPDWLLERIEGKKHLFEVQPPQNEVVLPAPREKDPNGDFTATVTQKVVNPDTARNGTSPSETDEGADGELKAPKRNGSEVDWREFANDAKEQGYPIAGDLDEMDRNEIIAACEEAKAIEPKK